MKQFSKDLGNVSLAPKGRWSKEQEYERLNLVYNDCDNLSYVAKIDVPIGVEIDNREYWQPMNATGYADNNFINLTTESENGTVTAYESLEEAVATILPINRRAGATLSFYNLNSDRLDRQAEFELWQFNSTDLANWENKDYWNNIYYNWNVFTGWYISIDSLENHVKIPNVGQYAYVGTNLNDALLYQCRTNGTWTNTGIKVRNYISVVVSGNITIGENGNWFNNGEDTGIPATPAVDEQLDNIIMQLQQHTIEISNLKKSDANLQDQITSNDSDITKLTAKHESLSRTVQGIAATGGASTATNVTYDKTNSGLNAENAQDAIDEVSSMVTYDVSARNNGAVFESLQALLSSSSLNTLIPTSVRHGGMTIRFIQGSEQSSDNKYVQYRLIDTSFSTTPSDWQGVDDEPITGSNNIVKSGYFNDKFGGTISNQYNVTIYGLNLFVHGSWKKGDTLAINLYGATVFSYQLNIYFEDGTNQVYYKNVGDYTYCDLPKDCNRVRAYANPSETIKNLGIYTLTVENTGSIAIEQKEILSYGIIDVDRLAPLDSGSYSLSSAATVVNQKGLFREGCIISFKNGAIKEVWQSVDPNYSTYYWRKLSSWERKEGILDLFLIQGRVTTYHTFDNNSDFKRTDYLELDGSDITGVLSGSGYSTPIAFYNENYTYIGSYSGTISAGTMPFTVPASSIPSNAKYVIFTNNLFDGHVFDGLAYINSGVKLPNLLKNEKGDILSLNPKDTVGNLVIQAKRPLANWHRQGTYNDILSMMVFTDLHADKVNLERIIKFDDEYSSYIDDYIQLGDIVDDNYGNDFSFFSNLPFSKKIMSAIGNHDTRANYDERETADNQWTLHAGIDAYNKYFAPFSSYWLANVVQPTNAASNGLCYYYKDYTSSKLRLIVLDCMKYTTEQLTWFANSLTNAISLGYSVIVAQHSNFGGYIPLGDFSSLDDSYADKSGGGDGNIDDYLDAVDTFINNGGTFICWLSGHMHVDCSGWIAYHNNQLAFVFECAKCSGAYSDGDRVLGEKSQDSFNIISVDTNANLVKVVRVGNDCDRYLRSRKSIVVNYLTKEIVSSM